MPWRLHLLPADPSARLRIERRLLVAALVGLALAVAIHWSPPRGNAAAFGEECAALDETASARVAQLVGDRSELAQAQLGDALFRLRRARSHCRNGWLALARQDYRALSDGRYGRRL